MSKIIPFTATIFFALSLSGCAAVGDIFQAGIWAGVLFVAGIMAVIIFLIARKTNKN